MTKESEKVKISKISRAQRHRNNGQGSHSQGAELKPNPGTFPSFELEVLKHLLS